MKSTENIPRWVKLLSPWVLAGYWITLFTMTHIPVPSGPPGSDKLLHIGAYGVLAFLLALTLHTRGFPRRKLIVTTIGSLFAFAVCDEVTQELVNRICDPLDALADWFGVLSGLGLFFAVIHRIFPSDALPTENTVS